MIAIELCLLAAAAPAALAAAVLGGRLVRGRIAALRLADTDDLTGLGDRRAFRRALAAAVQRAHRKGDPLSLLLLDVPAAAALHRTYGLRYTDAVLADAAWVLAAASAPERAFRIGGSTFALLLPGRRERAAAKLGESLRTPVAELTGAAGTVFAVCTLDERCPDAETLLIGADAALTDALWRALADALEEPSEADPPLEPWDIRHLTGPSA